MAKFVGRHTGTRVAVIVGEVLAAVLLLFSIFVVQSIILALLAVFVMVVAISYAPAFAAAAFTALTIC
jgi:hypothetical protein